MRYLCLIKRSTAQHYHLKIQPEPKSTVQMALDNGFRVQWNTHVALHYLFGTTIQIQKHKYLAKYKWHGQLLLTIVSIVQEGLPFSKSFD